MRAELVQSSVGACSDPQALLVQDAQDRLDFVALGSYLVDEGKGQQLRGLSSPVKKSMPDAGCRCPPEGACSPL